jgi:hypothetical protein
MPIIILGFQQNARTKTRVYTQLSDQNEGLHEIFHRTNVLFRKLIPEQGLRVDVLEQVCYNRDMTDAKYTLLEVLPDGTERRQYADGYIRNQRGQIIVLPENAPVITSENAHEYHKMRKEKILRAIESHVMDVTKTNIPADAIGRIVAKRAEIAMTDDTRTGNEAAKIVLAALDAYQPKQDETRTNVLRHEYTLDDDTRRILERMVAERRTNVLRIDAENSGEI